jgi:hypothetical protein
MKTRYLKVRMQAEAYEQLKNRAAKNGTAISTFACALLEFDESKLKIDFELAEIKSHLQELAVLLVTTNNKPTNGKEVNIRLLEVLLIARELAMDRNAQIISRVSMQIKSQIGVKNE